MNTTNNNGLNSVIIDMTPRQEPHDPQRGFGREVLRTVYYRITVEYYTYTFTHYSNNYEAEKKMGRENATKFFYEIVDILQSAGWTLANTGWKDRTRADCPQLTKGNQYLYCHPQNISGCVNADEVDVIASLFANAKTFKHYKTDDYRDVIVTADTDDEKRLYHQVFDGIARKTLEELTTTKRRDLYKAEWNVWHSLFDKLHIETKRAGEIYNFDHIEQEYAREVIEQAKADGWLITATGKNDTPLVRWPNKAEQKALTH